MITILWTLLPVLFLAPLLAGLIWLGGSQGRGLIGWLLFAAFLVSPAVVWIYFDYAVGPSVFPDTSLGDWKLKDLLLSREGIISGFLLLNLPGATQLFLWAFQAVDRLLVESAFCAGASRFKTLRRVVMPIARPAALAIGLGIFMIIAGEWSFLIAMCETSAVAKTLLMNLFQIKTVSLDLSTVLAATQSVEIGSLGDILLGLIFFCLVALGLYSYLQTRPEDPWASR